MAMQGANKQATQLRSPIALTTDAGENASATPLSTSNAAPVVNNQGGTAGGGFMQAPNAQPGATSNAAPTTTANPRYAASTATASRASQFETEDSGDEDEEWKEKRIDAARSGDRKAYERAARKGKDGIQKNDQILDSYLDESELDLAILAGSKKMVKALLQAGFQTASWRGLEDATLAQLTKLFRSKNEAEFEKAMSESGLQMNQLVVANIKTDLLLLACRIDSPKLAEAWIKAHPESLQSQRTGNLVLRRSELQVPIRAGSMAITKLMLDLGAIPDLTDVGSAKGQIQELLERTYNALL